MIKSNKFNSVLEFSGWLANNAPNKYFKEPHMQDSKLGSFDFCGTESYEEADGLLKFGWDRGFADVKKIMAERFDGIETARRLHISQIGVMPCIPAYLSGSPVHMLNVRKINRPKPVVTICYNCAISGCVEAEEIKTNAAKLFNVIRCLELSGVGVELWACSFSRAYGRRNTESLTLAVKVKDAGRLLNVLSMCYPICHPSFNRRHKFAYIERAGANSVWSGYGSAVTYQRDMVEMAASVGIVTENVFSFWDLENKTEDEILKLIK